MNIIYAIESKLWIVFTICYAYQIFYMVYMLLFRRNLSERFINRDPVLHKMAVVISARNEESVIGQLIESIHNQTYPAELIRIYVCADNCTDNTAQVARDAGAVVFERQNRNLVGKGYALDYMFKKIFASDDDSDAFIVFDADNLLDKNYIAEMNKTFGLGFDAITSYRNSKNYGTNWISAGYSLWFLREAKYLNNARLELNTSCAISGTGSLLSRKLVTENGGWKHHLLTEDVEFSVDSVIKGQKIGYCSTAMLYDEQPITFRQSWRQRMRWAKGFYQVLGKYGLKLAKNTVTKLSFACFDLLMTIFPAIFITLLSIICNVSRFIDSIFIARDGHEVFMALLSLMGYIGMVYGFLFVIGLITTLTEWDNIHTTKNKKIRYVFTFPLFMLTYIPIAIAAIFRRVEWTPIDHTISKSIHEVER